MPITPRIASAALALGLVALPGALPALDLPAGAESDGPVVAALDSYALPTGPWVDGLVPFELIEGRVSRQAWRVPGAGITTLQILAPLRTQLEAEGWEVIFDCHAATCGGFEFRFAIDVLPAPAMFVDLARYRFLSAVRKSDGDGARGAVSILVSRSEQANYVQIVQAGEAAQLAPVTTTAARAAPAAALPLAEALERDGRFILADLTFDTGSSSLGAGAFASLSALAAYLRANPARRVALVGHTDATGSLEGNIALSKRRAQSVRARLIDAHDIPPAQLAAEGMGYLAPVAANLTEEGREQNRRVEVILLSTD